MSIWSQIDKNISGNVFYSSSSCLKLSVSLRKSTLQLSISEAFDKTKKSLAAKGEKRYDHANSLIFSLNCREAAKIIKNIGSVIKGTYVEKKKDNKGSEVQINYLEFYHASKLLSIKCNEKKTLFLSIYDVEKKKTNTYVFLINSQEFYIFISSLKAFAEYFPFVSMCVSAFLKLVSWTEYNSSNKSFTNDKENINIQSSTSEEDEIFNSSESYTEDRETSSGSDEIYIDEFWK